MAEWRNWPFQVKPAKVVESDLPNDKALVLFVVDRLNHEHQMLQLAEMVIAAQLILLLILYVEQQGLAQLLFLFRKQLQLHLLPVRARFQPMARRAHILLDHSVLPVRHQKIDESLPKPRGR